MKFEPLTFNPLLKQTIWGGEKLKEEFNKNSSFSRVGESWEISCVPGNISVISNGEFAGKKLTEALSKYGAEILGGKVFKIYGPEMPLLFKFIDARDDLSIQVHPGDELAKKRHNSLGKTEMWYILSAEKGAKLYSGFKKRVAKEEYPELIKTGAITGVLASHEVKEGDAFFIPAGRVHAIGAGIVLAEVQQTSDVTYRIFDYNRKGPDGKERALHTRDALDAIDFTVEKNYKTQYAPRINEAVNIAKCDFFTVNLIELSGGLRRNLGRHDSFAVYMCAGGAAILRCGGAEIKLKQGDTVLVPSALAADISLSSEKAKLLEVYI
ncbi:mannose-6-phosphate isomerase [Bacteroidia bacterium]|nr:mannose-6-phosphate isomerase [Bacteroidia bacterium]